MAVTWRLERPETTTMKSASADFPLRSMETMSSPLESSRLWVTRSIAVPPAEISVAGASEGDVSKTPFA